MITLKELKNWVNSLPEAFDNFVIVNGEEGELDGEHWYRVDKPVVSLGVDEDTAEILIMNQPNEPLKPEDIKDGI